MKNRVLSWTVLLSMVLSCAGCGSTGGGESLAGASAAAGGSSSQNASQETAAPSGEQIKLNIWMAGSGEPIYDQTYRAVYDDFTEKNPNIGYELTFIPWGEYFTKLNTGLVGGAGPDIFMLGYGQMGTVQGMGHLLELDTYIPADWDGYTDFATNILDICKKDDKLYAMFAPSTRVYFYRKDIAQQQGVTEEELRIQTPEDLYNLARKMTVRDDKGNTVMSGLDITTSQNSPEQQFLAFMTYFTDNAALWNADLSPHFNSPAGVDTMKTLYGLYQEGVSLPSDPTSAALSIVSGLSAMSLAAEANYAQADAAFPGQIGILDCDLGSLLIGNYSAVNSATKYKQESVDMLLHMFSKESCSAFAKGTGQYAGRKSLDAEYVTLNPEYSKVVKAYEKSVPLGVSMNPHYNKMVSILRTATEQIYQGADPQTTLDQAAEEYKAVMSQQK